MDNENLGELQLPPPGLIRNEKDCLEEPALPNPFAHSNSLAQTIVAKQEQSTALLMEIADMLNNDTIIRAIRRLMSRSMWRFFYEMNMEYRIPNLTPEEAKKRGIPDAFEAYMKAHEGDWIRSASFQKMFIECNPLVLAPLSKFLYGDGAMVKGGMNLSDRVIECLKETEKFYAQEQSAFPRAAVATLLLKAYAKEKAEKGGN